MLDWNTHSKELSDRIAEVGRLSPDTTRGYPALGEGENQRTRREEP